MKKFYRAYQSFSKLCDDFGGFTSRIVKLEFFLYALFHTLLRQSTEDRLKADIRNLLSDPEYTTNEMLQKRLKRLSKKLFAITQDPKFFSQYVWGSDILMAKTKSILKELVVV